MPTTQKSIAYPLEQLFLDQERRFVVDTIPAVLAWVPRGTRKKGAPQPLMFALDWTPAPDAAAEHVELQLTWDLTALARHDPNVEERAANMSQGPHREHLTEIAAYGLALVAISTLLPGRRVVAYSVYSAPDLLFDVTPDFFRGVEVAGRSSGGRNALAVVRDGSKNVLGKRTELRAAPGIVEAYLSLWCASPRRGEFTKVKP